MPERRLGYLSAAPRVSTRPEAELGGPRSHVLGVIHAFERLGWKVDPYIVGDHVPLEWVAKGSTTKLQRSKLRVLMADVARMLMGVVNSFRARRHIGTGVDLVYERFAAFQAMGWAFQRKGVPWVLETNAPLFMEAKHDRQTIVLSSVARYLESRAYHSCDVLVCISDALRDIIIEFVGLPPEKIVVVPNGVDTSFFDPDNHPPPASSGIFTIGFVGRIIAWQGLSHLLAVTGELVAQGEDINLLLVGDGPARQELEEEARALGLEAHVKFAGYVSRDQVPGYIATFDAGFSGQIPLKVGKMYLSPLKLYEYMAMAKPVIASDFEDARRVVVEGETGFLFEGGNHESLKQAILAAMAFRDRLPAMGREARDIVVADHSWEARIRKMLAAIEQV